MLRLPSPPPPPSSKTQGSRAEEALRPATQERVLRDSWEEEEEEEEEDVEREEAGLAPKTVMLAASAEDRQSAGEVMFDVAFGSASSIFLSDRTSLRQWRRVSLVSSSAAPRMQGSISVSELPSLSGGSRHFRAANTREEGELLLLLLLPLAPSGAVRQILSSPLKKVETFIPDY